MSTPPPTALPDTLAHPALAWPFVEAARELGLPVDAGLEVVGWPTSPRADAARIAHSTANRLLGWAVELSGRADFGLLAARQVEPGHFDLVELASRSQRSVGEGLDTLVSLVQLLHGGLGLRVVRQAATSAVHVRLAGELRLHPCGYDFIAASFVIAGRRQTGESQLGLLAIEFPYPAPADPSYLADFFGCPVRFDAAELRLTFPTSALSRPLLRSDAHVGKLLSEAGQDLLAQAQPPPVAHELARLLRGWLGQREVTLPGAARALSMSERTLRRRLDQEGERFRNILDRERHARALQLLRDPQRSTDAVAEALGLSSAQALHRAFRRWTGETVQAHRARTRAARG